MLFSYPNIEAVIFDCDGVLVDTEHLKFLAWQSALENENISFTIEEYMPLIGYSSKHILQTVQQIKAIHIDEGVITLRRKNYHLLQEKGVPLFPEMIAFVRKLSQNKKQLGIKLGLASSSSTKEILNNLKQAGLEDIFDVITSGSDDLNHYIDKEERNKPKPYIYTEAARRLGVSPSQCLVFEDSSAGIEAAFRAGMIPIAIPNAFTSHQDFSKAAQIIYSRSVLSNIVTGTEKLL